MRMTSLRIWIQVTLSKSYDKNITQVPLLIYNNDNTSSQIFLNAVLIDAFMFEIPYIIWKINKSQEKKSLVM